MRGKLNTLVWGVVFAGLLSSGSEAFVSMHEMEVRISEECGSDKLERIEEVLIEGGFARTEIYSIDEGKALERIEKNGSIRFLWKHSEHKGLSVLISMEAPSGAMSLVVGEVHSLLDGGFSAKGSAIYDALVAQLVERFPSCEIVQSQARD